MGTCSKRDGSGVRVLRNSTTLVMHMKVYDESLQQGQQGLAGALQGRHRLSLSASLWPVLARWSCGPCPFLAQARS